MGCLPQIYYSTLHAASCIALWSFSTKLKTAVDLLPPRRRLRMLLDRLLCRTAQQAVSELWQNITQY